MVIGAPSDENETRQMLYTAYRHPGPAAVRYPRGTGPAAIILEEMGELEIGKSVEVRRGERVAILSFGTLLPAAMEAAERVNATVVDMRWVKPLDESAVLELAGRHELLVTLEDNAIAGGAGAAINEFLIANASSVALLNLGIQDAFIEHGSLEEQHAWAGLNSDAIHSKIRSRLSQLVPQIDLENAAKETILFRSEQ
jgi:1-deoxy-D-xylulose-5-phosphate synthase